MVGTSPSKHVEQDSLWPKQKEKEQNEDDYSAQLCNTLAYDDFSIVEVQTDLRQPWCVSIITTI